MAVVLTEPTPVPHSGRVGRKPIEGKVVVKINFTPEDLRYIDTVAQHFGLGDRSATLRFAVRELARRERMKISTDTTD